MNALTIGKKIASATTMSLALAGIIAASAFGLHEWADTEATRDVAAHTASRDSETPSAAVAAAAVVAASVDVAAATNDNGSGDVASTLNIGQ